MATVQLQWQLNAGEDGLFTLTVYGSDGITPVDLTGWSMQTLIMLPGTTTAFIAKTTGAGMTIVTPQSGATKGQVTILISRADTLGVQAGYYDSRIERTDAGADAWTDRGSFFLNG